MSRIREWMLSVGARVEETDTARGIRRIVVGSLWFSALAIPINSSFQWLDGFTWLGVVGYVQASCAWLALVLVARWPHRMTWWVNGMLVLFVSAGLIETWMRGGLLDAGLAAAWGIMGVLISLIALSMRWAFFWFVAHVGQVVVSVIMAGVDDPLYPASDPTIDAAVTLMLVSGVTFAVLAYFVRQRDRFQAQSDTLLRNVLPDGIASRLKQRGDTIADHFDSVTVLFADVVGFTPMSQTMHPSDLVALLSDLFSDLDTIVGELGLEKVKTVGDEYMVAGGVPVPRSDHAHAVAEFALRADKLASSRRFKGKQIRFRMGIHSGPVVAGVIGQRKFAYDLWGDTVNTASRLESHGVPGRIQISEATYEQIRDRFVCESRGPVDLKGRGMVSTWFLTGHRSAEPQPVSTDSDGSETSLAP